MVELDEHARPKQAVPEAKPLLLNAVHAMSVEDAVKIVRGSDTSVTDFFAAKTRAPLGEKVPRPSSRPRRGKVSLAAKYNAVAGKGSTFGPVQAGGRARSSSST